jgi:hypothetical protein
MYLKGLALLVFLSQAAVANDESLDSYSVIVLQGSEVREITETDFKNFFEGTLKLQKQQSDSSDANSYQYFAQSSTGPGGGRTTDKYIQNPSKPEDPIRAHENDLQKFLKNRSNGGGLLEVPNDSDSLCTPPTDGQFQSADVIKGAADSEKNNRKRYFLIKKSKAADR